MDIIELAKALGPAAGAVIVVVLFLRYLGQKDSRMDGLLTNHLKHVQDQHEKIVSVLEALRDVILKHVGMLKQ